MREQRTRRGRGRDNERGIAALEFVLVLPLLVAMLYAGVTFGQAIYARYQLASAANESARACALESTDMATCEQHVRQKIASVAHWCGGGGGDGDAGGSTGSGVQVSVSRRALAGLRHVDALCERLFREGSGVKRFFTMVVIRTAKEDTSVAL